MVQPSSSTTTHVVIITTWEKTGSYVGCTLWNDFIPHAIKTFDYCYSHFNLLFTSYYEATKAHHQQSFFFLQCLFFYYWQCVSIALQCAQAIVILQHAIMFEKHSSFVSHITTNASSSLANLWQMTTF